MYISELPLVEQYLLECWEDPRERLFVQIKVEHGTFGLEEDDIIANLRSFRESDKRHTRRES